MPQTNEEKTKGEPANSSKKRKTKSPDKDPAPELPANSAETDWVNDWRGGTHLMLPLSAAKTNTGEKYCF